MKERPILFSAPMVRAILDGTKTQTRRVVKPEGAHHLFPFLDLPGNPTGEWAWCSSSHVVSKHIRCPYGQPGDRLWVRETWQHSNFPLGPYDESCTVFYRADYMDDLHGPDGEKSPEGRYRNWVPSIHMFRSASRILLEITAVRIERLQDINAADAKSEGIEGQFEDGPWRNYQRDGHWFPEGKDAAPVMSYRTLWESINGPGSWDANPWVWVVEFKRV